MDPSIVCSDECIGLAHVRNSARLGVQSQTLFIYRNKNIAMCVSRLILFMKKKKVLFRAAKYLQRPDLRYSQEHAINQQKVLRKNKEKCYY